MSYNRLATAKNPYQGDTKKVLCVCSAGLLRSPTTAVILSQEPYNFNTRAAGITTEYALIPVDDALLYWADEIVCMSQEHRQQVEVLLKKLFDGAVDEYPPIIVLDIPDSFRYRDPELVKLIKKRYNTSQAIVTSNVTMPSTEIAGGADEFSSTR